MCAGRRLRWRVCCPRCSLAPGRIACMLAGAIIHRRDGAWLVGHTTSRTALLSPLRLPLRPQTLGHCRCTEPFINCLRRSCGDVTMVFVFVVGMSHSSYKSKNFMRGGGEPNPISLVLNCTLSTRQAVRATCKCTCAYADGAVVAVVFHRGRVVVGTRRGQGAGGRGGGSRGRAGSPDVHRKVGGHRKVEGWRAVGPQGKRRPPAHLLPPPP